MRIPRHIAIIPDGNRRWAVGEGLPKQDGYAHGLTPGVTCLHLAREAGVEEITYYGFTTDNGKRPRAEVEAFSNACVEAVARIAAEDVSLLVVGNTESPLFPRALRPYTRERVTLGDGGIKVNFLVNYGWEWDLSQMHTATTNRTTILSQLQSRDISRIDLILRWGGRNRLSGLLPLQSVYADYYPIAAMWPDFSPEHVRAAFEWYQRQDVTLGG